MEYGEPLFLNNLLLPFGFTVLNLGVGEVEIVPYLVSNN